MTNEEALDILVNKIQIDVRFVSDKECQDMQECLYKCKEALEKQMSQNGVIIKGVSQPTECNGCFFDNSTGRYCECCKAVDFSKFEETVSEILEEWYIASQEHRIPKWCPVEE